MIFIRENRTMILEKTGIWKNYEKKVGNMHQECLDDVTYMEVQIHNRENEQFVLIDSVAEQFSNEVIQSYYQKKQDYKTRK